MGQEGKNISATEFGKNDFRSNLSCASYQKLIGTKGVKLIMIETESEFC